ncbi:ATP-binding cassette subfamily B protein [Cereibacter ovatus]|uniref:ATP-binding cassette subfamily B protein n=1 Tax=Cereibacter ovatus TaxID=439529 RepID=A0A285D353_9RHOB|nr:ABC transporter ATP-binding protein [Cereibacter ovatus]SNX74115.1 ATP-binding cassette subfamily B protein [Cereibacter ovatus]
MTRRGRQALQNGPHGRAPRSLLWRLLRESVPQHRGKYLAAIVAMVLVAVSTAMTAWVMGAIVDSMNDSENRGRIFLVAAAVAVVFFMKGAASFAQMVLMTKAGSSIVAEKQIQLYNRLLEQGLNYFSTTDSSNVLVRVTQSAQRARKVIDTIVTGFVRDALTLLGLVGVMVYQQPVLSLVCLVVGPVALFFIQKILARVRALTAQELSGQAEIIKVVQETATGVRVIKAFALERRMALRMENAVRRVEKRINKMARLEAATTPLMDTLTGLAIAGVVMLSAVSVFGQSVGTPGQLMSFVTAFLMAYEPAKRLSKMRVSIERGMKGVQMMYDLLDQPRMMIDPPDAVDLPDGPGALKLEGVRFGYPRGKAVIDGITLDFPTGRTTALVGPSGGGKSTLLNLILRLYDPDEGRITLDGCDLRQATAASLRRKIAYVGQDTFLFSATVMENLRLVRPNATDDEVHKAARIAHADEFIQTLPQGYDTPIGENGAFLSGGQRQRLAIARAVLRQAPILLLDEATSALDSHSEAMVRDALDRITVGVTTIVVAHRLSTVLKADLICYLEGGRIVETGSLDQLLTRNGRFRALYEQQFAPA